jgi:hypothetical protein
VIVERTALERRVTASLDGGRIPVIVGGCGAGRTSALLRLARQVRPGHGQYLDFAAAATTPERCLAAVLAASRCRTKSGVAPTTPASARAAFDALLDFLDDAVALDGGPVTFFIDEILDVRTFESFPGLRHVQRDVIARLAASPARFVLASRFTARAHRLLRDAPPRFEVIHVPSLDWQDTQAIALQLDGARREWAADVAPGVTALAGGRAGCVMLLLEALVAMGFATDPVAALASLVAPDGRLTARCRESYEFRLHRARGYGALKAILGVLAADEPLNLTDIAHRLHRTPGSTKDYLSWLEDVDLVTSRGKKYAFEDPLLRLYVRLYGRPVPPTDDEIVREVTTYAAGRLPRAIESTADDLSAPMPDSMSADGDRASGIIEID